MEMLSKLFYGIKRGARARRLPEHMRKYVAVPGDAQPAEAGFTLLELLIAVTLVAVMAVGVWAALDLCVRTWTRGISVIDDNQRERSTRELVKKQIASAYPLVQSSAALPSGSPVTTRVRTSFTSSSSLTPVFLGGESGMRFVAPNSLLSMDSAGLVMVSYETEAYSDGNIVLVEREAPYTGQSASGGGYTSSVPVFFNLKECVFEYYDAGDGDNPAEWLTEWDAADRRRLPAAVRISMLFNDSDKDSPGIQMIIPLRAQYNYLQAQPQRQRVVRRQPFGALRR